MMSAHVFNRLVGNGSLALCLSGSARTAAATSVVVSSYCFMFDTSTANKNSMWTAKRSAKSDVIIGVNLCCKTLLIWQEQ